MSREKKRWKSMGPAFWAAGGHGGKYQKEVGPSSTILGAGHARVPDKVVLILIGMLTLIKGYQLQSCT